MEVYKEKISLEDIKNFIEGSDPQERIVNITYSYRDSFVKVYCRNKNDQKYCEKQNFYPFCWATRRACLKLCNGNKSDLVKKMNEFSIGVEKLSNKSTVTNELVEEFENGYMFMFYAKVPMSQIRFEQFFKECGNPIKNKRDKNGKEIIQSKKDENQYLSVTPEEQFMISTGKRFFKGYDDYDCLLRMIFDLETEGLDPKRHRIKANGIRMNRGFTINGKKYDSFEKNYYLKGETEKEKDASELNIIDKFLKAIYVIDPDVITAHNGEAFDWNFIIERCRMLGTSIEEMSAKYFDGDVIRKNNFPSILKLGGEVEEYFKTNVPHITVTDSLHAVRRAQATNSSFLESNLKYSANYLNVKQKNRVYTPGNEIDKILTDVVNSYAYNDKNGDWYMYDINAKESSKENFRLGKEGNKPFIMYKRNFVADGYELVSGKFIINKYLQGDLWECDRVEYTLNGTDFMLCKIMPVPFGKCCTMGTAGQWKSIMMAWSYANKLAIPKPENSKIATGGLSRLLCVGYVSNVIKLDYNSLYPSIILTWAISDTSDLMGAMLKMLEYVLTERETHKKLKKSAEKIKDKYEDIIYNGGVLSAEEDIIYQKSIADFKRSDNNQASVKKLGNSYFGSYSSVNGSVFPWKSKKCGEQTTCTGRQSLRLMISHFHNLGYEPIVGDTDGFNFKLPVEEFDSTVLKRQNVLSGDTKITIRNKEDKNEIICSVSELVNFTNYEILTCNGWKEPYSFKQIDY